MTLLREIQEAAIDPKIDIVTVLRKARLLAARLKNADFESWVLRELNGYPEDTELPPYRIKPVTSKANLVIGLTRLPHARVIPTLIPEKFRKWATTAYLRSSITEYASLVRSSELRVGGMLKSWWPQELAVKYGGSGYGNDLDRVECLEAWQEFGKDSLVGLIETVRTRVLEFALQIEMAAPEAGEAAAAGDAPLPQAQVTQIFYTTVVGNSNAISTGGGYTVQSTTAGVGVGDLPALLAALRDGGVPAEQVAELKTAAETSANQKAAMESWLARFTMSAATGVTSAAIRIAAKAIAQYLGVPTP
jgi:hypothetical protein